MRETSPLWAASTALVLLLSGCSSDGVRHTVADGVPADLDFPVSVSEIGWEWTAPEGDADLVAHPGPGGVLVLHGDGVVALAGDTGAELWEYRARGRQVAGDVSADGRLVALHVRDQGGRDEGTPVEMVVLDAATGKVLEQYTHETDPRDISAEGIGWDLAARNQIGVTQEAWFMADRAGTMAARELGTDEARWAVEDAFQCGDRAQEPQGLHVWEDVLVLVFACAPEGAEDTADFAVGFAGFDPSDGTELWRVDGDERISESHLFQHTSTVHPGGLLTVHYPLAEFDAVVDPLDGEVSTFQGKSKLVWASDDGSTLGWWDPDSYDYRFEDLDGEVLDEFGRTEPMLRDTIDPPVGLSEGVVRALADGLGEDRELATFHGFEADATFTWEEAVRAPKAQSVPGAVAVSFHTADARHVVVLQ